jgi:hypothetical protein
MFIVFAWYTPDYRHWADRLIANLKERGIPHDIIEVPKLSDSWEANTMAKPAHLLDAMSRHPGKTIVLVDVDCRVLGDLTGPLATVTGDVAFYARGYYRKKAGARFSTWSGTMVFRPTDGASRYVEAWKAAATEAPWGDVDQSAQLVAMTRCPGTNFQFLGVEWCAKEWDKVAAPIVLHDRGSWLSGVPKATRMQRRLAGLFGRLLPRRVAKPA